MWFNGAVVQCARLRDPRILEIRPWLLTPDALPDGFCYEFPTERRSRNTASWPNEAQINGQYKANKTKAAQAKVTDLHTRALALPTDQSTATYEQISLSQAKKQSKAWTMVELCEAVGLPLNDDTLKAVETVVNSNKPGTSKRVLYHEAVELLHRWHPQDPTDEYAAYGADACSIPWRKSKKSGAQHNVAIPDWSIDAKAAALRKAWLGHGSDEDEDPRRAIGYEQDVDDDDSRISYGPPFRVVKPETQPLTPGFREKANAVAYKRQQERREKREARQDAWKRRKVTDVICPACQRLSSLSGEELLDALGLSDTEVKRTPGLPGTKIQAELNKARLSQWTAPDGITLVQCGRCERIFEADGLSVAHWEPDTRRTDVSLDAEEQPEKIDNSLEARAARRKERPPWVPTDEPGSRGWWLAGTLDRIENKAPPTYFELNGRGIREVALREANGIYGTLTQPLTCHKVRLVDTWIIFPDLPCWEAIATLDRTMFREVSPLELCQNGTKSKRRLAQNKFVAARGYWLPRSKPGTSTGTLWAPQTDERRDIWNHARQCAISCGLNPDVITDVDDYAFLSEEFRPYPARAQFKNTNCEWQKGADVHTCTETDPYWGFDANSFHAGNSVVAYHIGGGEQTSIVLEWRIYPERDKDDNLVLSPLIHWHSNGKTCSGSVTVSRGLCRVGGNGNHTFDRIQLDFASAEWETKHGVSGVVIDDYTAQRIIKRGGRIVEYYDTGTPPPRGRPRVSNNEDLLAMLEDTLAQPWEYRCITERLTELGVGKAQPCCQCVSRWKPFQHPPRDWKMDKPRVVVWEFPKRPMPSEEFARSAAVLNAGVEGYHLHSPQSGKKYHDEKLAWIAKNRWHLDDVAKRRDIERKRKHLHHAGDWEPLAEYYEKVAGKRTFCPWTPPVKRRPWVESGRDLSGKTGVEE